MEKLLELLNDWERERVNHNTKEFIPYGESSFSDLSVERITSKKYGFIKWLIDNYYIELPMGLWVVKNYDKESGLFNYFSDYESLLMLLSVQENPIEFLIKLIQ